MTAVNRSAVASGFRYGPNAMSARTLETRSDSSAAL